MAKELLDQHHRRASLADGDQMVIAPGKVLDNIAEAMERVDLDIDTAISSALLVGHATSRLGTAASPMSSSGG